MRDTGKPDSASRHWETVYRTRPVDALSWFQAEPSLSQRLIVSAGIGKQEPIIDVGGGASSLVDHLLHDGHEDLTVLDISTAALASARDRLGSRQSAIKWVECDILDFIPTRKYALWHDRALFHFLTSEGQRQNYLEILKKALSPGGQVIVATFALGGPERCSGLRIRRYDEERLLHEFGPEFVLKEQTLEDHITPGGNTQRFAYFRLKLK